MIKVSGLLQERDQVAITNHSINIGKGCQSFHCDKKDGNRTRTRNKSN
jgi:hypothetical protein